MIRSGLLPGILSALLLGALLAQRPAPPDAADPTLAASRFAVLREVAAVADGALQRLEEAVTAAIDRGRLASALTVEGDEPPSSVYLEAARAAEAAAGPASEAATAVAGLRAVWPAVDPAAPGLPDGVTAVDLLGIGSQLREAAPAADAFVELRLAAGRTLAALDDALAALDADDPGAALAALEDAERARQRVAAWDEPPVVLSVWLDTTGRVIAAAREITAATVAGDAERAERAVAAYRKAVEGARQADIALALAISETGAGLAATPLRRLADAAAAIVAQRAAVASVLQAVP
ncbi:MAG TPA: hypothetical protein VFH63_07265 [candidate division Zixibacteria bacterium]|nr:hypothetical protein [candidate division Zixibacteria bacterium]